MLPNPPNNKYTGTYTLILPQADFVPHFAVPFECYSILVLRVVLHVLLSVMVLSHRPYYAVDKSNKEVQESAEIGPIPASALRPKID